MSLTYLYLEEQVTMTLQKEVQNHSGVDVRQLLYATFTQPSETKAADI